MSFEELLLEASKYSDLDRVAKNAKAYGIPYENISLSSRRDKKFMVYSPDSGEWVHFGAKGYEDYTKHRDRIRQFNYLQRASGIRGNWKSKKYSPNNLAINILWT
jgi:hypothetical protein